jgi:hypothetical protein
MPSQIVTLGIKLDPQLRLVQVKALVASRSLMADMATDYCYIHWGAANLNPLNKSVTSSGQPVYAHT